MDFQISVYLGNVNKQTRRAPCKSCDKMVQWAREAVASHKRKHCDNATEEEKKFFAKRKFNVMNSSGSESSAENIANNSDDSFILSELTNEKKQEINSALAKFFFRTGISFKLVESGAFKDLIKSLNSTYAQEMPSSFVLSGSLLDQEHSKLSTQLQKMLESSTDLVLVSDGWTNIRGDHIVNFCVKAPGNKPLFYKSINTSGVPQNAVAVAEAIGNVIDELGPDKFSCLITDNAPTMRSAWEKIEIKYPQISANGCAAHVLNLLIKDISSSKENSKTVKDAEKIIHFINNHHIVKAKFEEKRKAANVSTTLSTTVATRWYSQFTSGNNLLKSKYILMKMSDEDSVLLSGIEPKTKSDEVQKLMKSHEFWKRLDKYVKTIEYPSNIIGKKKFQ